MISFTGDLIKEKISAHQMNNKQSPTGSVITIEYYIFVIRSLILAMFLLKTSYGSNIIFSRYIFLKFLFLIYYVFIYLYYEIISDSILRGFWTILPNTFPISTHGHCDVGLALPNN